MPSFRVLGYYRDNDQVYDGDAAGDDVDVAIAGLRDAMYETERDNLMVVAVLDEEGHNLHGGDSSIAIAEWE